MFPGKPWIALCLLIPACEWASGLDPNTGGLAMGDADAWLPFSSVRLMASSSPALSTPSHDPLYRAPEPAPFGGDCAVGVMLASLSRLSRPNRLSPYPAPPA